VSTQLLQVFCVFSVFGGSLDFLALSLVLVWFSHHGKHEPHGRKSFFCVFGVFRGFDKLNHIWECSCTEHLCILNKLV